MNELIESVKAWDWRIILAPIIGIWIVRFFDWGSKDPGPSKTDEATELKRSQERLSNMIVVEEESSSEAAVEDENSQNGDK